MVYNFKRLASLINVTHKHRYLVSYYFSIETITGSGLFTSTLHIVLHSFSHMIEIHE